MVLNYAPYVFVVSYGSWSEGYRRGDESGTGIDQESGTMNMYVQFVLLLGLLGRRINWYLGPLTKE